MRLLSFTLPLLLLAACPSLGAPTTTSPSTEDADLLQTTVLIEETLIPTEVPVAVPRKEARSVPVFGDEAKLVEEDTVAKQDGTVLGDGTVPASESAAKAVDAEAATNPIEENASKPQPTTLIETVTPAEVPEALPREEAHVVPETGREDSEKTVDETKPTEEDTVAKKDDTVPADGTVTVTESVAKSVETAAEVPEALPRKEANEVPVVDETKPVEESTVAKTDDTVPESTVSVTESKPIDTETATKPIEEKASKPEPTMTIEEKVTPAEVPEAIPREEAKVVEVLGQEDKAATVTESKPVDEATVLESSPVEPTEEIETSSPQTTIETFTEIVTRTVVKEVTEATVPAEEIEKATETVATEESVVEIESSTVPEVTIDVDPEENATVPEEATVTEEATVSETENKAVVETSETTAETAVESETDTPTELIDVTEPTITEIDEVTELSVEEATEFTDTVEQTVKTTDETMDTVEPQEEEVVEEATVSAEETEEVTEIETVEETVAPESPDETSETVEEATVTEKEATVSEPKINKTVNGTISDSRARLDKIERDLEKAMKKLIALRDSTNDDSALAFPTVSADAMPGSGVSGNVPMCSCDQANSCRNESGAQMSECMNSCEDSLKVFGDDTKAYLECFSKNTDAIAEAENCLIKNQSEYCNPSGESKTVFIDQSVLVKLADITYASEPEATIKNDYLWKRDEAKYDKVQQFLHCTKNCLHKTFYTCTADKGCAVPVPTVDELTTKMRTCTKKSAKISQSIFTTCQCLAWQKGVTDLRGSCVVIGNQYYIDRA